MSLSVVQRRLFRDAQGVEYDIIGIPGDGSCGYKALSYILSGDEYDFARVIDDLCDGFEYNPLLFARQTDAGIANTNVFAYRNRLLNAVRDIGSKPFPQELWLEEAHLHVFSLMFDIAVFIYSEPMKGWVVYNQIGTRGFCTLYHTGHHFQCLQSTSNQAPPPRFALAQELTGIYNQYQVDLTKYSFVCVSPWPRAILDASIPNARTVGADKASGSTSLPQPTTSNPFPFAQPADPKCPKDQKLPVAPRRRAFFCTHEGCPGYGPVYKLSALACHVRLRHGSDDTVSGAKPVPSNRSQSSLSSNSPPTTSADQPDSENEHSVPNYGDVSSIFIDDDSHVDAANVCATTQTPTSHEAIAGGIIDDIVNKLFYADNANEAFDDTICSQTSCLVFKCNICDHLLSTARALSTHLSRMHDINRSKPLTGKVLTDIHAEEDMTSRLTVSDDLTNFCVKCSRQFASNRGLKIHLSRMHKQYLLDTHADTLAARFADALPDLVADVELQMTNFCQICNRKFFNGQGLKVHMSTKHKPLRAASPCDIAGLGTSERPSDLNNNPTISRRNTRSKTKGINSTDDFSYIAKKKSKVITSVSELYADFPALKNKCTEAHSLHTKLRAYHDHLLANVDNVSTEKLSHEITEVIADPKFISQERRPLTWSKDDETRLNVLSAESKTLPVPENWYWCAKPGSQQALFNTKRMEFCIETELKHKLLHCPNCKSTGILVGLNQIDSEVCYDCLQLQSRKVKKDKVLKYDKSWSKVKPTTNLFPKRAEAGHETEDLPLLTPGEKAVISLCHPVITMKTNFIANKRYRQESISLTQNSEHTWSRVLPRRDLHSRFVVVERRFKSCPNKYIIANVENVRQWLIYLFKHHTEYIRMRQNGLLEFDETALKALENDTELAEILHDPDNPHDLEVSEETGLPQGEMHGGLSKSEVFTFDNYPYLYLRSKQLLRIKQKGLIEVVEDSCVPRRPTYSASANICFPHNYPHAEMSPTDFGEYKLGQYLLKKQSLFAHKMADGSHFWNFSNDSIHMMYQYARLQEMRIHANVGYYLNQHPDAANAPLESVLNAFKEGANDEGLIDSKLPNLTGIMAQIPNTREHWFAERLAIESISKDLGDPNLFLTINCDPRAWPDVRELIYKLEHGECNEMDQNWFEQNTEKFTELMDKYAIQISIYLYCKAKIFMRAFLCGVCRVAPGELRKKSSESDWTLADKTDNSWYWGRVEFTETRGVQHWHFLAKLPNVLDTALLGRIIHNGRVVRQEMKCGNIRQDRVEEAWVMIEMGLLASRYCTLFAESISQASFYSEDMDVDTHLPDKVIDINKIRKEFVKNYVDKNVSLETHPIMRKFNSESCDPNQNVENANVAAVSCMHHCIAGVCGGDEKTGAGCRFSFPKKLLPHTVPAVMQINAQQMETHMLLKRTAERVPNLNKDFLNFWRANHDVTVLVDAGQKMRYATKYVSKSKKQTELIDEVITSLGKRSQDLLPPNMKQALSNLILADCSHRAFLSKPELAYKVADLPDVQKSFDAVSIVGHYPRASITQCLEDKSVVVYSDRTEYMAYAERCNEENIFKEFDGSELDMMCFREFAETLTYEWKLTNPEATPLSKKRKFRSRDINSGYWIFRERRTRRHIRWSTVIYSDRAHLYEPLEQGLTTSQTLYYDLPVQKRKQLQRAYQELVCYVPWQISPEETFLTADVQEMLKTKSVDPEADNRHSLLKLEHFHKVYMQLWDEGKVAPLGSQWHRDNQFSYTMFLTTLQNNDVSSDRALNKGVFTAQYEAAEELENTEVQIRPSLQDELDEADVPSILNFLPPDTFREVLQQDPPELSEISIAFPMQHEWQRREEMMGSGKSLLFFADPPAPAIARKRLSFWHKKAIDLMVTDAKQQILYIYGKAGTGKTEIALHICRRFKGRVQAGAGSGKAASNFNGPTVHAMFGWAHNEHEQTRSSAYSHAKLERLRVFYEHTNLFVIDEVNAMSAADLGLLDEVMCKLFDPDALLKGSDGKQKPFGGRKMLFLGDAAQLRPVGGAAISDKGAGESMDQEIGRRKSHVASTTLARTARGQAVYSEYLSKNCIWLEQGFRNRGLLQEILDRVRNGEQTREDLEKLMLQKSKFPNVQSDYGIHYSNEACCYNNWLDVWKTCKERKQRLYASRARYHTTGDNDLVVSTLAAIPAKNYQFAPDILCVSEGCEVRLVTNLNVSAGLVNSASGKVVKVLYNNADVTALLDGKHPSAYCIIVKFPSFRGFQHGDDRIFPFTNPLWVPVYPQKFFPDRIPPAVRKQQTPGSCYREQFPLDLSRNITAHRAQGQTWRDVLVSVDLGLSSPSGHAPLDVSSLIYVACTRVNDLKNLFVAPIFPTIWDAIGNAALDVTRRESEDSLRKDAEKFAIRIGAYQDFGNEHSFRPDYSQNPQEWLELRNNVIPPESSLARNAASEVAARNESMDGIVDDTSPPWLKPCESERHIGIDQGTVNFAIVAVDKARNGLPVVVGAELHNLRYGGLQDKFDATQLLLILQKNTSLMGWMQQPGYEHPLPQVDRVIVHLEQISMQNKYNKVFTKELGTLLQKLADVQRCVVKLSSPYLHRATGPMFQLGSDIVEACILQPSNFTLGKRKSTTPHPTARKIAPKKSTPKKPHSRRILDSDVEPDSTPDSTPHNSSEGSEPEHGDVGSAVDYKERKRMSSAVFKYIMHSDAEQQLSMQLHVSAHIQLHWTQMEAAKTINKFDDLGDALLHALNEILCGTTNYRPLIPSMPSLQVNRSVVVAILPHKAFWISLQCTWNVFTFENVGVYSTKLASDRKLFSTHTIQLIKCYMDPSLRRAVTTHAASESFTAVEHIRIVVKQLGAYHHLKLTSKDAGALTNAAVQAMKGLCDEAAVDSTLSVRNDKQLGWAYTRTMKNGKKIQISRSTGKHTNAMIACLEWAKQQLPDFVANRPLHMDRTEKLIFFHALATLASQQIESHQLEMLRLSPTAVERLCSTDFDDFDTQSLLADLILIGLSKNNQYINAIAPNYRSANK